MLDNIIEFLKSHIDTKVQPVTDIANILIVVVALLAFIIALKEYRSQKHHDRDETKREIDRANRESQISREESAKQIYRDYLRTALEYPELSSGIYDKDDPIQADKYDTFLSIMLWSFDEMVNYTESAYVVDVIKYQVGIHYDYIRSILHKSLPVEDSYRSVYSAKLLEYVDSALAEIDKKKIDKKKGVSQ
jgi:hypothetical protein